jgi:hypothetical protein
MANAGVLLARMMKNISAYSSKITIRYRGVPTMKIAVANSRRTERKSHCAQSTCREDE